MHDKTTPSSPAADTLRGTKAIAEFIGESMRRTIYLLETLRLPAGKLGANWIASRTRLAQFYAEIAAGERVA